MWTKLPIKRLRRSFLNKLIIFTLLFGILITFFNIYELKQLQSEHLKTLHSRTSIKAKNNNSILVYWIYGKKSGKSGYLKHVKNVFHSLGYVERMDNRTNWDVLWAHDYPFNVLKNELKNLKSHQKVNKFPGSGYITNKAELATSKIKQAPIAFKLPMDKNSFLLYIKNHPNKLWVQKSNNHRGIRIKQIKDLNLNSNGSFIQEYIDNPYLIDGRRFDIGIYTTLVSLTPTLRVYIYDGDWLIRYCNKNYEPFDPKDTKKYVVGDDYTPTWKMASLKHVYSDLMYTHRQSFFYYLRKKQHDSDKLTKQIIETIQDVYLTKSHLLRKQLLSFKRSSNFFEMVRFDFVVDKYLNVYLMEVNMSPNLSTAHFSQNQLLYEQVIFSLFNLVGIAKSLTPNWQKKSSQDIQNMQVSEKDVLVLPEICSKDICHHEKNCSNNYLCQLCKRCLTNTEMEDFKNAYLEKMNSNRWRRVIPEPFNDFRDALNWNKTIYDYYYKNNKVSIMKHRRFQKLIKADKKLFLWFHAKCLQENRWCL